MQPGKPPQRMSGRFRRFFCTATVYEIPDFSIVCMNEFVLQIVSNLLSPRNPHSGALFLPADVKPRGYFPPEGGSRVRPIKQVHAADCGFCDVTSPDAKTCTRMNKHRTKLNQHCTVFVFTAWVQHAPSLIDPPSVPVRLLHRTRSGQQREKQKACRRCGN